jgi:hypothetical protein
MVTLHEYEAMPQLKPKDHPLAFKAYTWFEGLGVGGKRLKMYASCSE